MSTTALSLLLLLLLVVLPVLLSAVIYNQLVTSRERTREAWSGIEIQLQRRAELVPNLVETVKGYAAHESDVFEEVTHARAAMASASGPERTAAADQLLSGALGRLMAVAEAYPELKASENFGALQSELSDIEEKVAYARQFYNRNAASFNARIARVPAVLVARATGMADFPLYRADEASLASPTVQFTGAT